MEYGAKAARRTDVSIKERLDWARKRWREDPQISVNGRHGMHALMMEVFGVSAHVNQLLEIHAEVERQRRDEEKARKDREQHFNSLGDKIKLQLAPALKPDQVARAAKRSADTPPPPAAPKPPATLPPITRAELGPLVNAPIMQPCRPPAAPPPAALPEGTQNGTQKQPSKSTADGTNPTHPAHGKVREDYARSIVTATMTRSELLRRLREKFGWGLESSLLSAIVSDARGRAPASPPRARAAGQEPGTSLRRDGAIREAYAREHATADMTGGQVIELVREHFGVGMSPNTAHRILRDLREAASYPAERPTKKAAPLEQKKAAEQPVRVSGKGHDPGPQIQAMMELLFEDVPGIKRLTADRGADGRVSIDWEIQMTASGRLSL